MKHLDLFSGIGGFAYAADQVWDNVEHIFRDNDKFCQQVLKKHWPESEIYDDIRTITTNPYDKGLQRSKETRNNGKDRKKSDDQRPRVSIDLLTGGFPCQPFSQAGKRKGTADNRYLWPEMLRVIRLTKPTWVIAENVRGLLTMQDGLVFEQVCLDLEGEGYTVQPFVIPATSKDAPHKRERIWICAYSNSNEYRSEKHIKENRNKNNISSQDKSTLHPRKSRRTSTSKEWDKNWREVATELCRVDDGIPNRVDRLKSLGNAIVPQVAIEIMKGLTWEKLKTQ